MITFSKKSKKYTPASLLACLHTKTDMQTSEFYSDY